MSIFGFDILQNITFSRFYSSDESTACPSERSEAAAANSNVENTIDGDVTSPPLQWIEMDQNSISSAAVEDEDGWEGITIVSSAQSSQVISCISVTDHFSASPPVEILAVSPFVSPQTSFPALLPSSLHPLSVATTESFYADRLESVSLSRSFSLSSSMAELSMHSAPPVSVVMVNTARSNRASDGTSPLQLGQNSTPSQHIMWYARFTNEDEWEQFRKLAFELLGALNEPVDSPDQTLSLMIQQEEAMFWEDPAERKRQELAARNMRYCKWGAIIIGEITLLLTAAALGSAGAARRSR